MPLGTDLEAGGAGQDYVTIGATGATGTVTTNSTDNGVSSQSPPTGGISEAPQGPVIEETHFKIERNGSVQSLSYSTDSKETWTEAGISPLTRDDRDGLVLEVGIYQTSTDQAMAVVDDFLLWSELIYTGSFE